MLFRLWFYACKLALAGSALAWIGAGFVLFTPWGAALMGVGLAVAASVVALGLALAIPFVWLGRPMACPFCGRGSQAVLFARTLSLECRHCGTVHGNPFRDSRLKVPDHPTRDWRRAEDLALSFDLDTSALNGVRIGEPLERLLALGPAEDLPALVTRNHGYLSLGLSLGTEGDDERITNYFLYWAGTGDVAYRQFAGSCLREGQQVRLSKFTTESEFAELLGPPFWRDDRDGEILLFYEFPGVEWQVEFGPDSRLRLLFAHDSPLMADEEQRQAYGVTAAWPPG